MACSITDGLYTDKLNPSLPRMTMDCVSSYLDYLGCVKLCDKDFMVIENYNPSSLNRSHSYDITFTCQVLEKDIDHFKDLPYFYYQHMDRYPKLNYNNIRSNLDLRDFSAVEYETVITFDFRVFVTVPEDINTELNKIKECTKNLLYKKFSDNIDEQIIDEIGE